ncbi:MAG: hypothetical protein ACREA7_09215 [Nitrosotalea sp.]
MNNLIRCLKCKKTLIKEELEGHTCERHFKGVRNIEVLDWWETKGDDGERVAFGLGSDGYTYRLIEPKEGFVEIDFTNRQLTGRKNNHEVNRTMFTSVKYQYFKVRYRYIICQKQVSNP